MLRMYQERGFDGIRAAQEAFITSSGQPWMSAEAFRSFELLNQASKAEADGDLSLARDLRNASAKELLHHEQRNVLQAMYDQPDFAAALQYNQQNLSTFKGKIAGLQPVEVVLAPNRPASPTDVRIQFSTDPTANLGSLAQRIPFVDRVLSVFLEEYNDPKSPVPEYLNVLSQSR